MRRSALLLLVCAPLAAAPVPPESDQARVTRTFGTWNDPRGDCAFKPVAGGVQVFLPAQARMMPNISDDVAGQVNTAPTFGHEIEGDFTAIVRVASVVPARAPDDSRTTMCCGGLSAVTDEENYVILRRGVVSGPKGPEEYVWLSIRHEQGSSVSTASPEGSGDAVFLRIRRVGDVAFCGWSRDGEKWFEFAKGKVPLGPKARVGIVAESNFGAPFTVTFDRYALTRPKR